MQMPACRELRIIQTPDHHTLGGPVLLRTKESPCGHGTQLWGVAMLEWYVQICTASQHHCESPLEPPLHLPAGRKMLSDRLKPMFRGGAAQRALRLLRPCTQPSRPERRGGLL